MPKAPTENRENGKDIEPKILNASKADAEQSKEALEALLDAKMKRIEAMKETVQDARGQEQYAVARNSVDQRQRLLLTVMA